jgi:hypothetical protein
MERRKTLAPFMCGREKEFEQTPTLLKHYFLLMSVWL